MFMKFNFSLVWSETQRIYKLFYYSTTTLPTIYTVDTCANDCWWLYFFLHEHNKHDHFVTSIQVQPTVLLYLSVASFPHCGIQHVLIFAYNLNFTKHGPSFFFWQTKCKQDVHLTFNWQPLFRHILETNKTTKTKPLVCLLFIN